LTPCSGHFTRGTGAVEIAETLNSGTAAFTNAA